MRTVDLDVVIFGGGAAGLWLLDELYRAGYRTALLEAHALGTGQTIASQGIIHGGVKYTLTGLLSESAKAIREMPGVWREALNGKREPDLSATNVLAEHCYLWRTQTLKSRLGMVGARSGLRSHVHPLPPERRPPVLAYCPGEIFQVDEQVIDVVSFLHNLRERHLPRLVKVDMDGGIDFELHSDGSVDALTLRTPGAQDLRLRPQSIVLTAGQGNADLRTRMNRPADAMQRRPLHMVMVRGNLPVLNGHCVDGAKTRVTVTTSRDSQYRTVWQLGGQVAEDGVRMSADEVIRHAQNEIREVLPSWNSQGTQWSAYRVERAEGRVPGGGRPAAPQLRTEANVITAWPTKLALAPELANLILKSLPEPAGPSSPADELPQDWPRPEVALPPWEAQDQWHDHPST